jgi:hypothetical protein
MARRVTTQDRTVRTRWASFLSPIVGTDPGISVAALSQSISANLARNGDAGWQVRDWLDGDRTVSPRLAFETGEALRACGIRWSTGFGALWGAGYFGAFTRRLATFARGDALPEDAPYSKSDVAVFIGMQTPLFASPGLVLDLFADANPYWLDAERRGFAEFVCPHLTGTHDETSGRRRALTRDEDELLEHAAALGDSQNIAIGIRERMVFTLVWEWANAAASPPLQQGRVANLGAILGARPRLLTERELEAAVARHRDQQRRVNAYWSNLPEERES